MVDSFGRRNADDGAARRWRLGWALGGAAVAAAAGLLVTIIALARRVTGQAADIEGAIEGARENTAPLFEIPAMNLTLDRVAAGLRGARQRS